MYECLNVKTRVHTTSLPETYVQYLSVDVGSLHDQRTLSRAMWSAKPVAEREP